MRSHLAFTGMRIGELKQLTWEDVDLDHNVIHVHRGGSGGKPKDKEDRFIPVHARKLDSEKGQSRTVVGQSGGNSEQTLPQVSHV